MKLSVGLLSQPTLACYVDNQDQSLAFKHVSELFDLLTINICRWDVKKRFEGREGSGHLVKLSEILLLIDFSLLARLLRDFFFDSLRLLILGD